MLLPTGNPLFERRNLNIVDVQILRDNLEKDKFSGYIALWETERKMKGCFFFCDGAIKNSIEFDDSGNIKLIKNPRLLNKMKIRSYFISVYVLSARISEVIAGSYLYDYLYKDYDIRKKEFKNFLSTIELDGVSGFASLNSQGTTKELIFSHGKIVMDNFTEEYGKIICQSERIDSLISYVMNTGAKLNFLGEKEDNISQKEALALKQLDFEKELIVKKLGGLGVASDTIRVDEMFYKQWDIKPSVKNSVDLETPDGNIHVIKCSSGKNLAGNAMLPDPLMKKLGVTEGAVIYIKPKF